MAKRKSQENDPQFEEGVEGMTPSFESPDEDPAAEATLEAPAELPEEGFSTVATPEVAATGTEPEAPEVPAEDPHAPVTGELHVPTTAGVKDPQSKEEIGAAIQEKLLNRDTSGEPGSEVNLQQLRNEVKQVAEKLGFPLSRGTEAGAALMARARKRNAR